MASLIYEDETLAVHNRTVRRRISHPSQVILTAKSCININITLPKCVTGGCILFPFSWCVLFILWQTGHRNRLSVTACTKTVWQGKKGCVPALLNESSWVSLSRRLCFQPKHTHVPKPSGETQEETRSVIPASVDRKLHAWFSLRFLAGNFTDNVVHKSIIVPLLSLPFKKSICMMKLNL